MSTAYSRVASTALPAHRVGYQDLATRAGYWLLTLIAVCSPWGDILRLGGGEGPAGRGVTTVIAILVIAISLMSTKFITAMASRPRVLFFAAFVAMGTVASLMQNVPLVASLTSGFNRGGYWLMMVAVMSLALTTEQSRSFVRVFAISTALMSVVSLIDYFQIADIPGFNEGHTTFRLDDRLIGKALFGPFPGRSILATYLALAWPVPLMELVHGKLKNPLRIALWASVLIVLTLAIFVSYSRALYLMIGVGAIYAIYSTNHLKILRIMLLVAPLLVALFLFAQYMFPREMEVFNQRLLSITPSHMVKTDVASFRLQILRTTIDDLLRNPQGMGFGTVQVGQQYFVTHSLFAEHLRPAGWLGFVFVCLFMWPLIKMLISRRNSPAVIVLCASMLGSLSYGIAHSTHTMLALWVVVGLLYGLSGRAGAQGSPWPQQPRPARVRSR